MLPLANWDIVTTTGEFAGIQATLPNWGPVDGFCDYAGEELDLCVHALDLTDNTQQGDGCVRVIADLHPDDVDNCMP